MISKYINRKTFSEKKYNKNNESKYENKNSGKIYNGIKYCIDEYKILYIETERKTVSIDISDLNGENIEEQVYYFWNKLSEDSELLSSIYKAKNIHAEIS